MIKGRKTGTTDLPLHYGKAPAWLFSRMKKLAREMVLVIAEEYGVEEVLRRLSDPAWFQAFGCVLGFDWHSSGLTTTTCAALKEGLSGIEKDVGIFPAGGKGARSRRTPEEIEAFCWDLGVDPAPLKYASKISAKVDSAAVQDGYQIYHHLFVFTKRGDWCVVQQGLNEASRLARRYHWVSFDLQDFVCEPHAAVCCDRRAKTLNMVARESSEARGAVVDISRERPERVISNLEKAAGQVLPHRHEISLADVNPGRLKSILLSTYERQPEDFESLLMIKGVGPRTIRALALLSELLYGTKVSWRDPARYSFAHGGKDGHPYPVDRAIYDRSISYLEEVVRHAKLGRSEKLGALRRLNALFGGE